jgi:hypothetical protein
MATRVRGVRGGSYCRLCDLHDDAFGQLEVLDALGDEVLLGQGGERAGVRFFARHRRAGWG